MLLKKKNLDKETLLRVHLFWGIDMEDTHGWSLLILLK